MIACPHLSAQPLMRTEDWRHADTLTGKALIVLSPGSLNTDQPDQLALFVRQQLQSGIQASPSTAFQYRQYQALIVLENTTPDTTARLLFYFKRNVVSRQCLRLSDRHAPTVWRNGLESWRQQAYHPLWYWPEHMHWLVVLEPGQRDTFMFQAESAHIPQLLVANAAQWQEQKIDGFTIIAHWYAFQIGLFGMLALLSLWRYIRRRDPAYLYYAGYLLATALLMWRGIQHQYLPLQWLFGPEWLILLWQNARMPIYIAMIVAYQSFFQAIVNADGQRPFVGRFVRYSNYALVGGALLVLLLPGRDHYIKIFAEYLDVLLSACIATWLLLLAWLWRGGLNAPQRWVFAGTLCLVSSLLAAIAIRTWRPEERLHQTATLDDLALSLGVLTESLCFAAALAYRHRTVLRRRDAAQKAYLTQLEENAQAAQQYQKTLNRQLQQQRHDLEKQYETVQMQRLAAIEAEYRQAVAETQLLALRGHLQPHFVVNCINSVRNLVAKNQTADAEQYLQKLSRMLRLVFEHTGRPAVSLREELDLLRLYLDLEKLRFRDRFRVEERFEAAPELLDVLIPPLLLQPYAENAVKHAFPVANPANRLLIGTGYRADGAPICYIEDNGIGRAAAAAQPAAPSSGHGLALCETRLRLFNERFQTNLTVAIIDLNPGTRIELG